MPEEIIIEHCSPTLAGIKTGNMFSVRMKENEDVYQEIRNLNDALREKGLRAIPLKVTPEYALIYLYRPKRLQRDLKNPHARSILKRRGYDLKSPEGGLVQLIRRLGTEEAFPHEIGLFLGYPPSDVECFMKSPRSGVQCSGCWKAYSNPEQAKKLFLRYQKCTETYQKLVKNGKTLAQLAVCTD